TSAASGNWTVLTPSEVKSARGDRVEVRSDGSVFVHPQQPVANDTYTVIVPSSMKGAVGLRLEALADVRLPSGGPGLAFGGDFAPEHTAAPRRPRDATGRGKSDRLPKRPRGL